MALTTQTMTDEQRKSVAIEYLKAFDNGGVTSTGDSILDALRRRRAGVLPEVGPGQRQGRDRQAVRRRRRHAEVHHAPLLALQLDLLRLRHDRLRGHQPRRAPGRPVAGRRPESAAGRWCDVFEIRDWLIQRFFIYLDPDYAGKDTARYPWLRPAAPTRGPCYRPGVRVRPSQARRRAESGTDDGSPQVGRLAAWAREGPPGRRHLRAVPAALRAGGPPRGRRARTPRRIGVLASTLQLMQEGATHVGVASDHVIESFRNDLWPGYKTSEGMPPGAARPDPGPRGRAGRDGRHHVGDGRVRGRRRARRGGRASPPPTTGSSRCSSARPTRTSASACAGSRVVQFDRRKRRDRRRGRRHRQVRRPPGVDPRLPGARRRHRRRLPRPAGLGRQERGRRCSPCTATSRTSRRAAGQWERARAAGRGEAGVHAAQPARRWPCCSGASPPSSSTSPVGTVDDWRVDRPDGRASPRWPSDDRRARADGRARRTGLAGSSRARRGRTRRLRRRPGDLRHTSGTAEGCYLPVLTWFTDARCTGPDRHLTRRVRSVMLRRSVRRRPSSDPASGACPTLEGCESGRIGTLGKRVWGNPPWVRIPLPPP